MCQLEAQEIRSFTRLAVLSEINEAYKYCTRCEDSHFYPSLPPSPKKDVNEKKIDSLSKNCVTMLILISYISNIQLYDLLFVSVLFELPWSKKSL